MKAKTVNHGFFLAVACLVGSASQTRGADEPKRSITDPEPGVFSRGYLNPPQLQFSCVGQADKEEDRLAELLEKGEPDERLAAARACGRAAAAGTPLTC